MTTPRFGQPRDLWEQDGSYRDIYIQGAELTDWESLCALAEDYDRRYWREGVEQAMPPVAQIFQDREHTHLMSVYIGAVRLNCHFFVASEIELDIDPREVTGPEEHHAVLGFLERAAGGRTRSYS